MRQGVLLVPVLLAPRFGGERRPSEVSLRGSVEGVEEIKRLLIERNPHIPWEPDSFATREDIIVLGDRAYIVRGFSSISEEDIKRGSIFAVTDEIHAIFGPQDAIGIGGLVKEPPKGIEQVCRKLAEMLEGSEYAERIGGESLVPAVNESVSLCYEASVLVTASKPSEFRRVWIFPCILTPESARSVSKGLTSHVLAMLRRFVLSGVRGAFLRTDWEGTLEEFYVFRRHVNEIYIEVKRHEEEILEEDFTLEPVFVYNSLQRSGEQGSYRFYNTHSAVLKMLASGMPDALFAVYLFHYQSAPLVPEPSGRSAENLTGLISYELKEGEIIISTRSGKLFLKEYLRMLRGKAHSETLKLVKGLASGHGVKPEELLDNIQKAIEKASVIVLLWSKELMLKGEMLRVADLLNYMSMAHKVFDKLIEEARKALSNGENVAGSFNKVGFTASLPAVGGKRDLTFGIELRAEWVKGDHVLLKLRLPRREVFSYARASSLYVAVAPFRGDGANAVVYYVSKPGKGQRVKLDEVVNKIEELAQKDKYFLGALQGRVFSEMSFPYSSFLEVILKIMKADLTSPTYSRIPAFLVKYKGGEVGVERQGSSRETKWARGSL